MAGLLKDKRIELWRRKTTGKDSNGFETIEEEKVADLWAYYRHNSAKEYYAAMSVQEKYQAIFIINHRADINPRSDYIIFRGLKYDIVSIDDFQGYKGDVKILANTNK